MEPKVSVIIPTYMRSGSVLTAVESVMNQTYPNIEVIVVDDNGIGSTEQNNTYKKLERYIGKGKIIYIPHLKNINGAAARNTGLRRAIGKYVALLDDDDYYLPDKIKKQVTFMESRDESWGACYTGYKRKLKSGDREYTKGKDGSLVKEILLNKVDMCSGSTLLFRKSIIEDCGYFDESLKRHQDYQFVLTIAVRYQIGFIPSIEAIIVETEKEFFFKTGEEIERIKKAFAVAVADIINKLPRKTQRTVMAHFYAEAGKFYLAEKDFKNVIRLMRESGHFFYSLLALIRKIFLHLYKRIT